MKTTTSLTTYILLAFCSISLWSQQGIGTNTPNPNTALDIVSAEKGVLIPRVSLTISNTLFPSVSATDDDTGILVFNQTDDAFFDPGFYFWDGTHWIALATTLNTKDEQQLSAVWQAASETYLFQLTNSASTTLNLSALEEVKSGATIGTISSTATDGDLFWDTDDDQLYAFDGSTWNLLQTHLPKLSFGPLATATATQTTLLLEDNSNSLSLQASGALRFSQTGTNTLRLSVAEAAAQNLGFITSNSSTASITISGGTAVALQASGSIRFLNNNNALVIKSDFNEIKDNDGDTKIVIESGGNDQDEIHFFTAGSGSNTGGTQQMTINNNGDITLGDPGDYTASGGTDSRFIALNTPSPHGRLRITAGSEDTFNPMEGASVDLHGIAATANAGNLDLVAGDDRTTQGDINFWTGTTNRAILSGTGSFTLLAGTTFIYNQGTVAQGSVLTADANGAATWQRVRNNNAPFTTVTADTNLAAATHHTVLAQPNGSTDITLSLPAAATAGAGTFFIIKMQRNGNSTGNVVISPNGLETIDGASNRSLSNNFQKMTLQTDGSNWFVISE